MPAFNITDLGQVGSKRQLQIDLTINADARFDQLTGSPHAPGSDDFKAQFDFYANDLEYQYKHGPNFAVADQARSATWETRPEGEYYICTVSFPIRGAIARVVTFADSPYAPETPETPEHADWLDQQGAQAMQAWFSERPQLTPVESMISLSLPGSLN